MLCSDDIRVNHATLRWLFGDDHPASKTATTKKEKAEGNRLWLLLFKVFLYTGRQPHNFYPF